MGSDPAEELTVAIGRRDGTLELTLIERTTWGETLFRATYRNTEFSGSVVVSDFRADGLVPIFKVMALHWRGFDDVLSWADHEGRLSLTGTSDMKGHVLIAVRLNRLVPDATLEAKLTVEADEWPQIVSKLTKLFPNQ